MRTGEAAISWGRDQITNPSQDWTRLCLKFVRSCYGIPAMYADAGKAWDNARMRHSTRDPLAIPRGAPAFFETPGTADHIVLGLGRGLCLTNDWSAPGKISVARITDIVRGWNAPLLGWTEDLNGAPVYTPPTPAPSTPKSTVAQTALVALDNAWTDDREVIWKNFDVLIRHGGREAAEALVARDTIRGAMIRFLHSTNRDD